MKKLFVPMIIIMLLVLVSCTSDIVKEGGVVVRAQRQEETTINKTQAPANLKEEYPDEDIVYTTKSGTKYHKQDCTYLSSSKIPISLEQAINEGKEPCSRCYPDN